MSHEFPLNGNLENPYCFGVSGVIQAYQKSLTTVQLYGPTNAAPIINHVANFAEKASMIPNAQVRQTVAVVVVVIDILSNLVLFFLGLRAHFV